MVPLAVRFFCRLFDFFFRSLVKQGYFWKRFYQSKALGEPHA
jgi:hypothetical protein